MSAYPSRCTEEYHAGPCLGRMSYLIPSSRECAGSELSIEGHEHEILRLAHEGFRERQRPIDVITILHSFETRLETVVHHVATSRAPLTGRCGGWFAPISHHKCGCLSNPIVYQITASDGED